MVLWFDVKYLLYIHKKLLWPMFYNKVSCTKWNTVQFIWIQLLLLPYLHYNHQTDLLKVSEIENMPIKVKKIFILNQNKILVGWHKKTPFKSRRNF